MELDQDHPLTAEPAPRRPWLWVLAIFSSTALVLGIVVSLCLLPYHQARVAAIRLHALGASIDYNEASLSRQFREGWHYFSNANLAITASAIYCRKDRDRTIADQDLVHVRAFPELYWLDLRDQSISSQGLRHISGLDLEALTLTRTSVGSTPNGLAPLGTLRKLQVLKLNQTPIDDDDLKALATLDRLNSLDLSRTAISSAGIAHFSGLARTSALNLSGTKVTDDVTTHLGKLKDLLTLNLGNTAVTGAGLDLLRGSRLRDLAVADTPLTDDGVRAISQLPLLTDVNLARTRVSPAALHELTKLKHLRSLNISGPAFGDEHLAALSGSPRLQSLRVYGAKISPHGLQKLQHLTTLNRIEIEGNLLWNPEIVAALKAFPKLTTVEFKLSGKMLFDFAEVQQQLGPNIRIYEVSESGAAN